MLSFVMMRVARMPMSPTSPRTPDSSSTKSPTLRLRSNKQDQPRHEIAEDRLQAESEADANGAGEHRKLGQRNAHESGCDQHADHDQDVLGEAGDRVDRRPERPAGGSSRNA